MIGKICTCVEPDPQACGISGIPEIDEGRFYWCKICHGELGIEYAMFKAKRDLKEISEQIILKEAEDIINAEDTSNDKASNDMA